MDELKKLIREVPDYPKPGILFYDVTTLLKDKKGFHTLIDKLCEHYDGHPIDPPLILRRHEGASADDAAWDGVGSIEESSPLPVAS